MSARSRVPDSRRIARERIEVLFGEAGKFFAENPGWSDRCVALARKIATKQRIRIDREFRRRFCRDCGAFLVPGVNQRIRVQRGRVSATCLVCGKTARYRVVRRYERRARA
ncbi:MAG: ribonuclease P [Methanoregulaceae archaeon]